MPTYQFEFKEITKCIKCPCVYTMDLDKEYYCNLAPKEHEWTKVYDKPEWCPLKEVESSEKV